MSAGSTGSGPARARTASAAATAAAPSSTDSRSRVSALVANRVWTTERSSAKSRTIAASATASTGVPATATSARLRSASPAVRSAWTTSVVVPDREIATATSYRRPGGTSDAAKASVSPRPARSRSAA